MLTLSKGQQLADRFTLLSLKGQGGMGEVWLADDSELGEPVALKILTPVLAEIPGMVEVLRQECRNARRLIHPNIVRVFDFHAADGAFFISMQYVESTDFKALKGDDYTLHLQRLLPVIEALDYAHSLGVVHRDTKPGNMLLDQRGNSFLTDFGIAAAMADDAAPAMLSRGSLFYQSPQQISRESATPADDVYGIGAVMYELIGGHPPFFPDISDQKILHEVPPPLVTNVPVPVQLEQLIFRMLAKNPNDRPSGMREVRDELAAILNVGAGGTAPPELIVQPALTGHGSDAITPVSRRAAPTGAVGPDRTRSQPTVPAGIAWVSLAILILVAAGVFFYLPKNISPPEVDLSTLNQRQQTDTPAVASSSAGATAGGLAPYEQAQLNLQREEAQRIVTQMLRKQAALEKQGVMVWGALAFALVQEEADRGDDLFLAKEYTAAGEAYQNGLTQLAALQAKARDTLQTAISDGWQAFDERDSRMAVDRFQLALIVDSQNAEARRGLRRAQNLDQVLKNYREGQRLEKQSDFAGARAAFTEVLNIDPEFEPAREGLQRVGGQIATNRFAQAMSDGFTALGREDYDAARTAFMRAERIRPASPEPKDGLAQVAFEENQSAIQDLRRQARLMEKSERWSEASGRYEKVLKLDANLTFAQEGRARARNMAQLYEQVILYVSQPERMVTDSVYQNALSLYHEASALEDRGPVLTAQLVQLERQIRDARQAVQVILQSDNLTDVSLFRVGSLGTFESTKLTLFPGTYTVQGTRPGYRDVRQKFTVVAGQTPPLIIIRCEERI